jgi:Poly(ADP-ribose) polymerase catalytic domain
MELQVQGLFKPVCLSSPLYDEVCARIRDSYPNSCVLYIDEVTNPELRQKYEARKDSIPNVQEKRLFHGTKFVNIDSIAKHGFDTKLNKTSAFGRGTYFATNASYSREYSNKDQEDISYMFLCDVLVGRCKRFGGSEKIDTESYDTGVDSVEAPSIYVCPYNDGCYPTYLVAFHKNAK